VTLLGKIVKIGLGKIFHFLLGEMFQMFRKIKYFLISDNRCTKNEARFFQPAIFSGYGSISIGASTIGVIKSPFYHSSYCYLEARSQESSIVIGNNSFFNNNLTIIADKTNIIIKDNCLFGPNLSIYDSDFHEIDPKNRNSGNQLCAPVIIEENVFIGSNVTILKGITIGRNSVIASGSVVANSIPENVIAGGVPAKVLKSIN